MTYKYAPNPPADGVAYTEKEKMECFCSVVYGGYSMDIVPEEFKDELRSKFFEMMENPEKYLNP